MGTKKIKWLCLLLATLMMVSAFAACGQTSEDPKDESSTGAGTADSGTVNETETLDEAKAALDEIGKFEYGKDRDFAVLYSTRFENEIVGLNEKVDAEGGNSQVINDAVYTRNSLLEDICGLTFTYIDRDDGGLISMAQNEASAPTGDFQLIDGMINSSASLATGNYLYDYNELGVDLDAPWWDSGTADFVLAGGVYFMCGTLNIGDDGVTYVLIFNKEMRKTYANTVPNPYDTVRNWEWTLDHFNTIIQGVSSENGDGKWNELDTYGFITTWEYGNTFYLGSDLRYVINDESVDEPYLYLAEGANMEKALNVLDLAQTIYHDNNASFMSPPGQEGLGVTAFKESRGMFFGEIVNHLATLNKEMDGEYGIVPVPKYDKAQEFYRTWSHDSGSTFSVTSAIPEKDKDMIGDILTVYAILSHQHLKPAYYDTVLTSRNVRDADSAEMMDLIFQNRVCDMGFYFPQDLGFYNLFKSSVNDENVPFSSSYERTAKSFPQKMARILRKLEKN